MPFKLCNAKTTFQRCMIPIFLDLVGKCMEIFIDDLSVFEPSFDDCLSNLSKELKSCREKSMTLNSEKYHFMVKKG